MPRLQALGKPRTEREIRIAFQFVNGLLVNAVLNDPGPLSVDDVEMEQNIAQFLCFFFGIQYIVKSQKRKSTGNRTSK
jgi:hypothetical protein